MSLPAKPCPNHMGRVLSLKGRDFMSQPVIYSPKDRREVCLTRRVRERHSFWTSKEFFYYSKLFFL